VQSLFEGVELDAAAARDLNRAPPRPAAAGAAPAAAATTTREGPTHATVEVVKLAMARPLSTDDLRVLGLFGIDKTRAEALVNLLRTVSALPKSEGLRKTLSGAQIANDSQIQTLCGDLCDEIVTTTMRLVLELLPPAERKKVFIFDAAHAHNMKPDGGEEHPVWRRLFTDHYGGRHVSPDTECLIVPTNPGRHWIINVINTVGDTICSLEPLNDNREGFNQPMRRRLEAFMAHERKRAKLAPRAAPRRVIAKPSNLPTQTDGTSCGAFCFAYVYFEFVYGRLPTRADFTGANQLALRLAMLDAAITGSVKRGALPGAAAATGGTGAGAGGAGAGVVNAGAGAGDTEMGVAAGGAPAASMRRNAPAPATTVIDDSDEEAAPTLGRRAGARR
jgi:hypothetical protein